MRKMKTQMVARQKQRKQICFEEGLVSFGGLLFEGSRWVFTRVLGFPRAKPCSTQHPANKNGVRMCQITPGGGGKNKSDTRRSHSPEP